MRLVLRAGEWEGNLFSIIDHILFCKEHRRNIKRYVSGTIKVRRDTWIISDESRENAESPRGGDL
jgi:ribosomal protein S28E/S33